MVSPLTRAIETAIGLFGDAPMLISSLHLERLEQIKKLQANGRMLSDIGRQLNEEPEVTPATAWMQYAVADDVVVWVKAGASPWRTRQVRAAVEELARRVKPEKEGS